MDGKTLISVRNGNNGFTGYSIPDRGIWRNFAPEETKKISFEELQQLQYQPGGDYMLKNLLIIEDAEALKELNIEVEPEYSYTKVDIRNLLLNGTEDQVRDFLDFAPEGAIETAKDIAVAEEIPDVRIRKAISEVTGFNIDNAINVNHVLATEEDAAAKEEPKKQRRTAVPTAESTEGKTRRAAAPTYKVVEKK